MIKLGTVPVPYGKWLIFSQIGWISSGQFIDKKKHKYSRNKLHIEKIFFPVKNASQGIVLVGHVILGPSTL